MKFVDDDDDDDDDVFMRQQLWQQALCVLVLRPAVRFLFLT